MPKLRIAVLGAGLAGANCAWALAKAGCQVTVFEAIAPANGASGNWVGAIHPHVSLDDAPLSRLSRMGLRCTQKSLRELSSMGLMREQEDFAFPGHVQLLNHAQLDKWQKAMSAFSPQDASSIQNFGFDWVDGKVPGFEQHQIQNPFGYHFAKSGWIKPYRWVEAALGAAKSLGATLQLGQAGKVGDVNALLDMLERFNWVVVATGEQTLPLLGLPSCNAQGQTLAGVVYGQITKVARSNQRMALPKTLSGACYAIDPPLDDALVLGASYDRNPRESIHNMTKVDFEHVAKFHAVLPDWPLGQILAHRRSARLNWYDRLPVVGPCGALGPKFKRVVLCTALGSRGLTWASLAAQLVVKSIHEPRWCQQQNNWQQASKASESLPNESWCEEALLQKLAPRFRGVSL